jgi:hypothetical protein
MRHILLIDVHDGRKTRDCAFEVMWQFVDGEMWMELWIWFHWWMFRGAFR